MRVVEIHVTVDNITTLGVAQQCFWGKICVAGNNKTYLSLQAKCPTFLFDFNRSWNYSAEFHKAPDIKVHGNPPNGSRADNMRTTDGQTDGHADMKKLSLQAPFAITRTGLIKDRGKLSSNLEHAYFRNAVLWRFCALLHGPYCSLVLFTENTN